CPPNARVSSCGPRRPRQNGCAATLDRPAHDLQIRLAIPPRQFTDAAKEPIMSNRQILNFIDGKYTEGTLGRTFEDRTPIDNSVIAIVHEAGEADVDAAVQAARRALKGPWGKMSVQQRADLLLKVAAGINKRFDEFLEAEIADTGKPVTLASHLDI